MSTTTALLLNLRVKLRDLGEISFSDYELLRKLEEADREIRRLAAIYKPSYLAEPHEGTCVPGERLVTLPPHTLLLEVILDGEPLRAIDMDEFAAWSGQLTAKPSRYMSFGKIAFRWAPVPDLPYTFEAWLIPVAAPLLKDEEMPWPPEFDDLILDYALHRCTGEGGDFIPKWHDQVVSMLSGSPPRQTVVEGYFLEVRR